MILSHTGGVTYSIEQCEQVIQNNNSSFQNYLSMDLEPVRFLELLSGISTEMGVELNGTAWRIAKVES